MSINDTVDLAFDAAKVSQAMCEFGDSFVRHIGRALAVADRANTIKIKNTWPEYWNTYLTMYEKM